MKKKDKLLEYIFGVTNEDTVTEDFVDEFAKELEAKALLDSKKRVEELKKSDELVKSKVQGDIIIPKRISTDQAPELNEQVFKPRKEKNMPFSDEEIKEIEKTISDIRYEIRQKDKFVQKEEKKLIKEGYKLTKLVTKTSKKLNNMLEKGSFSNSDIEKTLELKENYVSKLKEIHDNIKTVASKYTPEMSLQERRKQIYNDAYNAETERAQKIISWRENVKLGKSEFNWGNHVDDSDKVMPDKNASLEERKRQANWEEEVKKFKSDIED